VALGAPAMEDAARGPTVVVLSLPQRHIPLRSAAIIQSATCPAVDTFPRKSDETIVVLRMPFLKIERLGMNRAW